MSLLLARLSLVEAAVAVVYQFFRGRGRGRR